MAREKIAITVDGRLLAQVEKLRRVTHESRSAVFARGVRKLVAAEHHQRQIDRYLEAYRQMPESDEEQAAAYRLACAALAQVPWECE